MSTDLVPVTPALRPQSSWLVDQLPSVLADDEFLRRFLGIFEEITDSIVRRIDGLHHAIDPSVAPPQAVRWMGHWLGLDIEPTLPEDRQRRFLETVGPLFGWRGTAVGLEKMLEALTGVAATVADSGGVFAEGTVGVLGPKKVTVELDNAGGLSDGQVMDLVLLEMPADVNVELVIGGRHLHGDRVHRKAPRLEKAPTPGEQALMGFVSGDRRTLGEAAFEGPGGDGRPGPLPQADDEGDDYGEEEQ
jgi:phage tail-like protein